MSIFGGSLELLRDRRLFKNHTIKELMEHQMTCVMRKRRKKKMIHKGMIYIYLVCPPNHRDNLIQQPPWKGLLCMSTLFQNIFLQSKQSTRVSIFSTSLVISPLHLATCSCGYLIAFVHEDLDSNLCLAYYTLLILFSHISSFKPISSFRYIYSNLKVLI